jgi:hypothetical protein
MPIELPDDMVKAVMAFRHLPVDETHLDLAERMYIAQEIGYRLDRDFVDKKCAKKKNGYPFQSRYRKVDNKDDRKFAEGIMQLCWFNENFKSIIDSLLYCQGGQLCHVRVKGGEDLHAYYGVDRRVPSDKVEKEMRRESYSYSAGLALGENDRRMLLKYAELVLSLCREAIGMFEESDMIYLPRTHDIKYSYDFTETVRKLKKYEKRILTRMG